jgi:uncharacterized protein (DUF885 family)
MKNSSRRAILARVLVASAAAWAAFNTPVSTAAEAATAAAAASPAAAGTPGAQLQALFDADWQWRLRTFPEMATFLGDTRYDDRLTDRSSAALDAQEAHARQVLAQIEAIDPSALGERDRLSYDVFLHNARQAVAELEFPQLRTWGFSNKAGIHLEFSHLMSSMPLRTERDYRNYLARLAAFPAAVAQQVALLRQGVAQRWVTFRPSLAQVPAQIDAQFHADAARSPLYKPFTALPADWPQPLRQELQRAGREAIATHYFGGLRTLRRFVVDEYLPHSPQDGAMSSYPGGEAVYKLKVREQTTTGMAPQEIHALGQREVARIRGEMEALIKRTGFKGGFPAFVKDLRTNPRFYWRSSEELLSGYRDIAKRVDPELPKLFAELPRMPYGIRPIPAHFGPGAPEHYQPGAADGSRAGYFYANVQSLKLRPKWEMEALFLHEAVPGHHLQIARALELGDLPMFRRANWSVAYGEGWALYAETLGEQLGLYTDPYAKFGQLRMEIWRAARLVVDTGIHAMGWSHKQAVDWMAERSGTPREDVSAEVDRYFVWPGQALGYKIGQLKISELRDRARASLGERFDLRRFHMQVLDEGALPLAVLEQRVDRWIAAEQTAPAAQATGTGMQQRSR